MTPDARVQELLPCPLCGCSAPLMEVTISEVVVRCPWCHIRIHRPTGITSPQSGIDSARATWNTRASTPETERLRSVLQRWAAWSAGHEDDLLPGKYRSELTDLQRDTDSLLTPPRDPQ